MAGRGQSSAVHEMQSIQKRMNQLFENALARTDFDAAGGVGAWTPVTDVYETDDTFVVLVELPGLGQDAIDVRVDGDDLVVEGERRMEREQPGEHFHRVERSYGRFSRRFRLPSAVDRESVDAVYRLGVLTVRLAKTARREPRPIRVSVR